MDSTRALQDLVEEVSLLQVDIARVGFQTQEAVSNGRVSGVLTTLKQLDTACQGNAFSPVSFEGVCQEMHNTAKPMPLRFSPVSQ
eukprot:m.353559 g.353559  ORF g.353559 m.353559 type:complete len:85 (+) comp16795_c0_seq1:201-455(+)